MKKANVGYLLSVFVFGMILLFVGATTSLAGTLFNDGDFATLNQLSGSFTAGTQIVNTWYTQKGTNFAGRVTTGGNPGNFVKMGLYGSQLLVALTAPTMATTWAITFDQKISQVWGGPNFKVMGLTNGQTIGYAYGGGQGGTLITSQITGTQTSWAQKSYNVNIPAGYSVIVLEWWTDQSNDNEGYDNITVSDGSTGSPLPTATPTATSSPTATITSSVIPSISPTPTVTVTLIASPTVTPTTTITPTSSQAGAIFNDGDFVTVNQLSGSFTAGTQSVNTWYTQKGGNYATRVTSGGNPGNFVKMGLYCSQLVLGLNAPGSATTWTISFDQKISQIWNGPNFKVMALTNGQTVPYVSGGGEGGTVLLSVNTGTQSVWTRKSYNVNIPAGYSVILLEWWTDQGNDNEGYDNVQVTGVGGATPTPSPSPTATVTPTASPTQPPSGYKVFNRVRFYPRSGYASRMLNGTFQGSNTSQTNDFVILATISSTPAENQWTEITFQNATAYRYIKYYSPGGSYGNVAELEFYENSTRLYGASFGSAGGNGYANALDGNIATYFDSSVADGNYVGLDIASSASIVSAPTFNPAPGSYQTTQTVTLSSSTSGATIRYTTDGSNPTRTSGTVYSSGITVSSSTTMKAIAYKDGMFDSSVSTGVYSIGGSQVTGYTTYHIGNSLTDTINGWLDPIADSAGYNHTYYRSTIPGAGIQWNWEHPGNSNGEPDYRVVFDTKVLDYLFLQPFANPPGLNSDDTNSMNFYNRGKTHSPNLQLWLYMQWGGQDAKENAYASASWMSPPWDAPYDVPANWEQGTLNHQAYVEALRARLVPQITAKPVYIVPGGLALINLKNEIEAGRVPGITSFFSNHYSDNIHLSTKGQYLIGLVHFACLYKRSPEGIVTYANTGLTQDQARIYQRIAWDTVRNYQYSGAYGM